MTEAETIQLLHKYYEITKPIYNCWHGDNLSSSIVKILSCSPKRMCYNGYETVDIKVIVYFNSRSYSYQTTDPRDEGWGIENGDFYNDRTITVPSFIFDMDFLDEPVVLKHLFWLGNQNKVSKLHETIANCKREIEEAFEGLKEMESIMGGNGDLRIERGSIVKGGINKDSS